MCETSGIKGQQVPGILQFLSLGLGLGLGLLPKLDFKEAALLVSPECAFKLQFWKVSTLKEKRDYI